MPSVIQGSRHTDTVWDATTPLIKRDVYEAIYNFDPYQTPIQQFFMANKAAKLATGNPKFELIEDVLVPHTFTTSTAITAASSAALTVDNGYSVVVGSVVKSTGSSGQVAKVSVVTNATTITIVHLDGSSNLTAETGTNTWIILGSSHAEGSASPAARSTLATFPYNYAQIQKRSVNMSGTQMATENYGGSDWANQRVKATKEFKLDLERMWVFGTRYLLTTAGANAWYSGGLLDSAGAGISNASQFVGSDFAGEDFFFKTFCKNLFAKGSNEKVLYCGADALLGINDYSKVKQQTKVAEKEYGVDIQVILTPFGRLRLVWHPLLEAGVANYAIGVDRGVDFFKYRYLSANGVSRDMQYQQNIQTPDVDARKDQYLAQVGLHLGGGGQGVHRILYPGASA